MSKDEIERTVSRLVEQVQVVSVDISDLHPRELRLLHWDLDHAEVEWQEQGNCITVELPERLVPRHELLRLLRLYGLEVRGL